MKHALCLLAALFLASLAAVEGAERSLSALRHLVVTGKWPNAGCQAEARGSGSEMDRCHASIARSDRGGAPAKEGSALFLDSPLVMKSGEKLTAPPENATHASFNSLLSHAALLRVTRGVVHWPILSAPPSWQSRFGSAFCISGIGAGECCLRSEMDPPTDMSSQRQNVKRLLQATQMHQSR